MLTWHDGLACSGMTAKPRIVIYCLQHLSLDKCRSLFSETRSLFPSLVTSSVTQTLPPGQKEVGEGYLVLGRKRGLPHGWSIKHMLAPRLHSNPRFSVLCLSTPRAGHEVVGVDGVEAAVWQLQRDSWLKFETFQAEPSAESSGRRPGFVPAPTFEKMRLGYVFKTDTQGTGYYLDKKAVKVTFTRLGCQRQHATRGQQCDLCSTVGSQVTTF